MDRYNREGGAFPHLNDEETPSGVVLKGSGGVSHDSYTGSRRRAIASSSPLNVTREGPISGGGGFPLARDYSTDPRGYLGGSAGGQSRRSFHQMTVPASVPVLPAKLGDSSRPDAISTSQSDEDTCDIASSGKELGAAALLLLAASKTPPGGGRLRKDRTGGEGSKRVRDISKSRADTGLIVENAFLGVDAKANGETESPQFPPPFRHLHTSWKLRLTPNASPLTPDGSGATFPSGKEPVGQASVNGAMWQGGSAASDVRRCGAGEHQPGGIGGRCSDGTRVLGRRALAPEFSPEVRRKRGENDGASAMSHADNGIPLQSISRSGSSVHITEPGRPRQLLNESSLLKVSPRNESFSSVDGAALQDCRRMVQAVPRCAPSLQLLASPTRHRANEAVASPGRNAVLGIPRGRRSPSPPRAAGRRRPEGYRAGGSTHGSTNNARPKRWWGEKHSPAGIGGVHASRPSTSARGSESQVGVPVSGPSYGQECSTAAGGAAGSNENARSVMVGSNLGKRADRSDDRESVVEYAQHPGAWQARAMDGRKDVCPRSTYVQMRGDEADCAGGKTGTQRSVKRRKGTTTPKTSLPRSSGVGEEAISKLHRACNHCLDKKAACTGDRPCMQCSRKAINCVFSVSHKQRLPLEPSVQELASCRPLAMDMDYDVSHSSEEPLRRGTASSTPRKSPRKKSNNLVWSQFRKACDRCTDKKVRCDGSNPTGGFKACTPCKRVGETCLFGICRRSGPRNDFEKVTERLGQCRTVGCRFANADGSFWKEHFHCRIGHCSFAGKNMSALLLHRDNEHPEVPKGPTPGTRSGEVLTSEVVKEAAILKKARSSALSV